MRCCRRGASSSGDVGDVGDAADSLHSKSSVEGCAYTCVYESAWYT